MDAHGPPLPPQAGGGGGAGGNAPAGTASGASSAAAAKLRKRTKTGCLTCRKRRIKCGEERPICQNCIKSKRTCEGYNQRLNWKPPIADWGGIGEETQLLQYHNGMLGNQAMGSYRPVPPPIDTAGFVNPQLQRDQAVGVVTENGEHLFNPNNPGVSYMQNVPGLQVPSPYTPFPPSWTPLTPQYHPMYQQSPMSAVSTQSLPPNFPNSAQQGHHMDGSQPNHEMLRQQYRRPSQQLTEIPTPTSLVHQEHPPFIAAHQQQAASGTPLQPQAVSWWESNEQVPAHAPGIQERGWPPTTGPTATSIPPEYSGSDTILSPTATAPQAAKFLGQSLIGATAQFLEEAAVETYEDGYYDVESDEEMEDVPEKAFQQLSLMRKLHQDHLNELSMRRYDTFLYHGMLDHYRAEEHANPLGNPKTARVFAHFIFATGPSLSIFERHPRNPSALFNETPSDHQQGLWTYTLPMKAIFNQGLLHAMLALSSLHISKLQGTASMPSYKHYAYAIKRIHKNVGNESKKLLPTTIAATLLLGFYEVLTADHLKWSSHLAGAKQLLQAIPFKRMARDARRYKAQQVAQKEQFAFYDGNDFGAGLDRNARDMSATIDEGLVSNLMGRQVKVEQFGQVLDDDEDASHPNAAQQPFDMGKYELYQDLFWWYARQDVYQAILSGNKLLLDYHRWTDCPPRASMGRSDAIYGTHDHLIVLFARIADFNARDRRRKIKVMESNGGHWRPPPGMKMPGPPPGMGGPPPGMGGPPPGMGGPPPGMQGPPPMASPGNNPNAAFMNMNAGAGMPPPSMPQHMPPQHQSAGPPPGFGPNPNMGHSQGMSPQNYNQMPGAQAGQPYRGPNQHGQMPPHPAQSPIGTSPNFKHDRGFHEASPNAPYSSSNMPSTPGLADPRRGSMGHPPPPPPPTFYGMAPLPTTVNMPSSYASNAAHSTPSPKSEKSDYDMDAATDSALAEWAQLKAALNTFESHLGPHFQPMPADVHPPTMTPFGPALFYRSHDVGIIWAMYYMACIIVHRCHPHMPPAAMMAAGIAAQQTVQYATRIGQIVGGIVPPVMGPDLNPNLGACLCEASLPLFFAGVQYQDPDQRQWLVGFLRNVELRTGWKSIGMVAQGCETAWEKAFEMGRGPPYKRKFDQWHLDTAYDSRVARITGNYTAIDHDHPDISGKIPRDHQGTRVHWAMGILSVDEEETESESRHISGLQPSKVPSG